MVTVRSSRTLVSCVCRARRVLWATINLPRNKRNKRCRVRRLDRDPRAPRSGPRRARCDLIDTNTDTVCAPRNTFTIGYHITITIDSLILFINICELLSLRDCHFSATSKVRGCSANVPWDREELFLLGPPDNNAHNKSRPISETAAHIALRPLLEPSEIATIKCSIRLLSVNFPFAICTMGSRLYLQTGTP